MNLPAFTFGSVCSSVYHDPPLSAPSHAALVSSFRLCNVLFLLSKASVVCNASLWVIALRLNLHNVLRASPKILGNIHSFIEVIKLLTAALALGDRADFISNTLPA